MRRAQPPPDLERVARILGGGAGAGEHGGSGVVEGEKGAHEGDGEGRRPGWVPVLPSRAVGPPTPAEQLDTDLRRARRPGVVTTPEPMRLGRWSVSNATVVALIALVVAVACVFAVRVLWAERSAGAAVPVTGEGRATGVIVTSPTSSGAATAGATSEGSAEGSGAGSAGRSTAGPSPSGAEIVVHVVGQVVRPGLVRLRQGARVADAVAAAGGARSGADLAALNLARLVVDGEQLHVPKPGEVVAPPVARSGSAGGSGTVGGGGAGGGGGGSGGGPVSLNTADLAALDSLPGVGPVLAQRILDWRAEHGRFTSVDELGEVSGIGDKLLGRLRPQVML
ncbi:hypothetical protein GCM10009826_14740 [Humibacillus xanthopallidus]